jgi:carboxypeptidase C (cathepsin A)
MRSVASKIATIANANYSVLIYNGQLDAIIPASTTMHWVDQLSWFAADQLRQAPRTIWKVRPDDREIAGYIKTANQNRFYLAIVRNAGHMGPYDQPRAILDLLDRFVSDAERTTCQ